MELKQAIMTNCPCYRAGGKIVVKGLMLHSVGCAQPNAQVFINMFGAPTYTAASVHGFIDANTGVAYQTLPWNHLAWHCGGTGNSTHIGVEMCEPAEIRYTGGANFVVLDAVKARAAAKRTYDTAVELFAYLCKIYKLDPKTQIISHNEGGRRGIASGHVDPEHLWTQLSLPYTMNGFREDVRKAMLGDTTPTTPPTTPEKPVSELYRVRISWDDAKSQIGAYRVLEYAKAACKPGYTVYDSNGKAVFTVGTKNEPYTVRVTIKDLNIRAGAGTQYDVKGVCPPGVYTIVETNGNWGKLKSGAGWICLDYTE